MEEEVFPLAVNLMDRFLAVHQLRKSQLQLVASVALFISSKMVDTSPFAADKLVIYTDYSITLDELMVGTQY
jgi:hypothetical protein